MMADIPGGQKKQSLQMSYQQKRIINFIRFWNNYEQKTFSPILGKLTLINSQIQKYWLLVYIQSKASDNWSINRNVFSPILGKLTFFL